MGLKKKLDNINEYLEENEIIGSIVYILLGMILAIAVYKGLGLMLGTEDPIVVVLSCSMLPVLDRGDLLILTGAEPDELKAGGPPTGDIIVYFCPSDNTNCPAGNKLIVHRLYKKNDDGTMTSWGDNNPVADSWAIQPEWIKGKVLYRIPFLGIPKIILTDILSGNIKDFLNYRFTC